MDNSINLFITKWIFKLSRVCATTERQCVYDYFNSYSNDMWCCSRRWQWCCQRDCSLACYREINKFKSVTLHKGSLICFLHFLVFENKNNKQEFLIIYSIIDPPSAIISSIRGYILCHWPLYSTTVGNVARTVFGFSTQIWFCINILKMHNLQDLLLSFNRYK